MDNPAENVSEVADSPQEQVEAETTPETPQAEEKDSRESTLGKITDILRRGRESSDKDADIEPDESGEPKEEPESEDEDGQGDVIDPKFVAAARNYGWPDARIQKYASEHDDADLVTLTGIMSEAVQENDFDDFSLEDDIEEPTAPDDVLTTLEGLEGEGALMDAVKSLAQENRTTREMMRKMAEATQKTTEDRDRDVWRQRLSEADELFDNAAEEFKELGKTEEMVKLPSGDYSPDDPVVKVREEIFDKAKTFNGTGLSWNQSLKEAMRWYRGGREDVVEAKVLRKIAKNASRITPKRDRRHQTKKFDSEIEKKADVVNAVLRKHRLPELPI